jgi:uncharacterized membrane protein YfhO
MKKNLIFVAALFCLLTLLFFYPILKNEIPFPGDLLIGEYAPYSSYSYFGYNPGSYPNKGQDFDVLRLIFPAKEFAIESLKNGQLPLWNPYNFSGNPELAMLQGGTFYPVNILFFIFPFVVAWTLYIMLQPILAGFFTFLLLREYKLSNVSSFFGGVIFAFSSFMTVWVEYGNQDHTFIWLPLVLFLLTRNLKKPTVLKSVLIILALSFSILAGYIQESIYVFIFSFLYVLFVSFFINRKEWIKNILISLVVFIFPIFLTSVQTFPLVDIFFKSTRNEYSADAIFSLLIPIKHLATLFIPDFFGNPATRNYFLSGTYIERVSYVGIIPIFFVFYSLLKRITKIEVFYILGAAVVFILTFDTFISHFLYTYLRLPIISSGVPTRMMFLSAFSLSVLSAFGFYEYEKSKKNKKLFISIGVFIILFLSFWGYILFSQKLFQNESVSNLFISKHNLILPTLIFALGVVLLLFGSIFKKFKKAVLFAVLILTIFDLFYFFQKITPFSPRDSVYPKTEVLEQLKKIEGIDRVWGYGSGHIPTNIQTEENIFSTEGYNALHLKDYGQLLTVGKDGKINFSPPRSDAILQPGFGEDDLKENKYRQALLDILGVKYILNKTNLSIPDTITFPEKDYKLVWQKGEWQIYQNKNSLPRFFMTSNIKIEKDPQKTVDYLLRNPTSKTIVLNINEKEFQGLKKNNEGIAKLNFYAANAVGISTISTESAMLFLSDSYDQGWSAKIDGNYAKIFKADYAFRAIFVPKGKHDIVFSYYPKSYDLGLKVSAVSLVLGVLIILILKRERVD